MTPEERQNQREQMRAKRPGALQELVDNGTLTQEQAQAITKVLPMGR